MYCKYCGHPVDDNAIYCPTCGKKLGENKEEVKVEVVGVNTPSKRNDTLAQLGLVFCIINTVIAGFCLIPLIWMLPITLSINNSIRDNKPISFALKVCTCIFLSLIGGVLLILADEVDQ